MSDDIAINRDVWARMFRNVRDGKTFRTYPNETVVMWLLGYARTEHEDKRVLDLGCGQSQCLGLFMNEGFSYSGVDVTDAAFVPNDILAANGWADRALLSVFTPPVLDFADGTFSHVISTEALHFNANPQAMKAMIAEIHRVLAPGGRLLVTVIKPDFWFMREGSASWVSKETIEVTGGHQNQDKVNARYFVYKNEAQIKSYFGAFSKVCVGSESREFGEEPDRVRSHWVISATK